MSLLTIQLTPRNRRRRRIRATISGTSQRPRLAVFRSSKHISAQLIDDERGQTMAMATDQALAKTSSLPEGLTGKIAKAYQVGLLLADRAKEKKITSVVFDRSGYRYHGRVKALAEGARAGQLLF